jgi:hypothetical protein
MAVSFSAQVFVTPLVVNYFHRIQTMAVFSNLIVVPLTSLITYLLFFSILFGPVLAPVLEVIFCAIALLLGGLVAVSRFFAAIPFSSLSMTVPSVMLIFFYFLFVKRSRRIAVYAMLAVAFISTLSSLPEFTTIVRSSDATMIEAPGGDRILISKKNSPVDAFAFNVSSVSYLVAGRDMFPHAKEFFKMPERLHYIRLSLAGTVVEVGRKAQVSLGQCIVDLDARKPGDGCLLYILTNGRKVCEFERPVHCSLVEQLIADARLIVARFRLLFS